MQDDDLASARLHSVPPTPVALFYCCGSILQHPFDPPSPCPPVASSPLQDVFFYGCEPQATQATAGGGGGGGGSSQKLRASASAAAATLAAAMQQQQQPSSSEGLPSQAYMSSGAWDPAASALATPWPSLGAVEPPVRLSASGVGGALLGGGGGGGIAPPPPQVGVAPAGPPGGTGGGTVAPASGLNARATARMRVRMLPYLASRSPSGHFSIAKSHFKVRKAKMSAARVVVNR